MLTLALGFQVVRLKQRNAVLEANVQLSTRAFMRGTALPLLPVQAAGGRETVLPSLCRARRRLVTVFTQRACKACERVAPLWEEVARSRKDVDVVTVYVDAGPDKSAPASSLPVFMTTAANLGTFVRVGSAPSVMITDSACRVDAAAVGAEGVRSALGQLTR
ncbi:MAG: hypothetical protein AVDCRST_MAG89-5276 [uncultured Gemmatimonadetes bacterium]|uniref:Thioredoxin domain-containing protein n=1 Tax=uncultured Gemmatimonadota bacterium TaxID=203437 RepID=A0A6J4N6Z9_9BACT|nr:MAG: hypothetical protein AVDCRST_MAG89-5276 [uncultured Gemmatimonadota bacterium]